MHSEGTFDCAFVGQHPKLSRIYVVYSNAGMLMTGEALLVLLTPHLQPEAVPQLSLAWAIRLTGVAMTNLQLMVWLYDINHMCNWTCDQAAFLAFGISLSWGQPSGRSS
jgi:hypothetical protein